MFTALLAKAEMLDTIDNAAINQFSKLGPQKAGLRYSDPSAIVSRNYKEYLNCNGFS